PGQGRSRAKRALWHGQWRDAKGLRFYLLDGDRIVHGLSWHQVPNEEQLGEALKQIKEAGVIPEDQGRLCVVCDGAEWIWKHVQALFPQARQVLDSYHCAQYLHRVATAHYGASVQAVEWVEATMTRLSLGKVGLVLGGLRRMHAQSDDAEKAIANCWAYLNEHRGRTHYRHLRRRAQDAEHTDVEREMDCAQVDDHLTDGRRLEIRMQKSVPDVIEHEAAQL